MPLALVALAWLLLMTGINGNYTAVGSQFETDVLNNGQGGGFLQFMAGILGIAIFFRVIGLPNAGRVFLILVLIVFILENENVLTALQNFGSATTTSANTLTATPGSAAASGVTATKAAGASPNGLLAAFASIGQQVTTQPIGSVGATGESSGTGSST